MSATTIKIIYWATTGLFSVAMFASAVQYLTKEEMKEIFVHLGFPAYFRVELAIAKMLGVAALLLPVPPTLKEWAYAGFAITVMSAAIAHICRKDPPPRVIAPIAAGAVMTASYLSFHWLTPV